MKSPVLTATILGLMATTAQAQASCVADFSAFGQGSMTVDIKPAAQEGRVDAVVNGSVTNAGTLVVDETIRAGLNLAPNPDSPEFKQLNSAERSLVHLHWISTTSPTRDVIKLPFAPADVRRLKTIDLIGKTDKFGGQVLMEAFDERGTSLGKVIRRVFAATCR